MKQEIKVFSKKQIEAAINKSRKQLCSIMRAHMKKNKIVPHKLGLITGMQTNHIKKKLKGNESMDLGTLFKLAMGLNLHVTIDATGLNAFLNITVSHHSPIMDMSGSMSEKAPGQLTDLMSMDLK